MKFTRPGVQWDSTLAVLMVPSDPSTSLGVKVFKGTGQSQLPEPSFQKLATDQRGENHPWVSWGELLPLLPVDRREGDLRTLGGGRAWSG